MTDKELMQQALEALEWEWGGEPQGTLTWGAITALRERLAQPEQEPVAWKDRTYGNLHHQDFGNSIPLYTTPPRREWVGLTGEELDLIARTAADLYDAALKTEAKLREKNS